MIKKKYVHDIKAVRSEENLNQKAMITNTALVCVADDNCKVLKNSTPKLVFPTLTIEERYQEPESTKQRSAPNPMTFVDN